MIYKDQNYVEEYTLFTNLEFVIINRMQMYCHALLRQKTQDALEGKDRWQLRGFGMDPAWPVFAVELNNGRYALTAGASLNALQWSEGDRLFGEKLLPLASSYLMEVYKADGKKVSLRLDLIVQDQKSPLRVDHFTGPANERPVLKVWEILRPRALQYYTPGTNAPGLVWGLVVSGRKRHVLEWIAKGFCFCGHADVLHQGAALNEEKLICLVDYHPWFQRGVSCRRPTFTEVAEARRQLEQLDASGESCDE